MGIFSGLFAIIAVVNTVVVGLFGLFARVFFRLAVNITVEGGETAIMFGVGEARERGSEGARERGSEGARE